MGLLGWLWLLSPFAVIAVIARDPELQASVVNHYNGCRAAGWAGVVMMFAGAALAPAVGGTLMYVIGTPLAGLVVWLRDERDDGHGDDGGGQDPEVPPPDWDEFERSFWGYVRRGRRPRLPQTPSGV